MITALEMATKLRQALASSNSFEARVLVTEVAEELENISKDALDQVVLGEHKTRRPDESKD